MSVAKEGFENRLCRGAMPHARVHTVVVGFWEKPQRGSARTRAVWAEPAEGGASSAPPAGSAPDPSLKGWKAGFAN